MVGGPKPVEALRRSRYVRDTLFENLPNKVAPFCVLEKVRPFGNVPSEVTVGVGQPVTLTLLLHGVSA